MTSQMTKDFSLKSKLRKFADGGGLQRRPFEPVVGTNSPLPSGGGGGLSREAVAAAQPRLQPQAQPAIQPKSGVGALPADYLRKPASALRAREQTAGLADGGSKSPSFLDRARQALGGRSRQIEGAVDAASGAPAPRPVQAPAPQPAPRPVNPDATPENPAGIKFADGGDMDEAAMLALANGGKVKGKGGPTDDKVGPVMLSDEEYVLPGDTADAIGRDKLDALRLATHEFKDPKKESALRKNAVGLADGGRKPNAFGDAAAGPGYNVIPTGAPPPQAPVPQAPTGAPPVGQRPFIAGAGPNAQVGVPPGSEPKTFVRPQQPSRALVPTGPGVGAGGAGNGPPIQPGASSPIGPDGKPFSQSRALAVIPEAAAPAAQAAGGVMSKLRRVANLGGRLGALGAAVPAVANAYDDNATERYAKRFGMDEPSYDGSLGDIGKQVALRGLGFASDVGDTATFGLASGLYRDKQGVNTTTMGAGVGGIAGVIGGGKGGPLVGKGADALARLATKGKYKGNLGERFMGGTGKLAGGAIGATAGMAAGASIDPNDPNVIGSGDDAVRTGGAAAEGRKDTPQAPVDEAKAKALAYQRGRLNEMGVYDGVQDSAPAASREQMPGYMKTGGAKEFQNLGTFGGNANIYGKASDPSKPGRINSFAGVGAGASKENEHNGAGWVGGTSASTHASNNYGSDGNLAMSPLRAAPPRSNAAEINKNYDAMLKGGSGKSVNGLSWAQRHGASIERDRQSALREDAQNQTALRGQDITAETSRNNNAAMNETSRINAQGTRDAARLSAQSAAAERALTRESAAATRAEAKEAAGYKRVNDAIEGAFTGAEGINHEEMNWFKQYMGSGTAMYGEGENAVPVSSLSPTQMMAALPQLLQDARLTQAVNKTAERGSMFSDGSGGVTGSPETYTEGTSEIGDVFNGNLPAWDWAKSKVGDNRVLRGNRTGQTALRSDVVRPNNSDDKVTALRNLAQGK